MAFHGDLSSYPLPDLLQWLDASRKSGALSLSWEGSARRIYLSSGQLIAASAPGLWERLARVLAHTGEVRGERCLAALRRGDSQGEATDAAVRQVAEEELLGALVDLTPSAGTFHWTGDSDRGEDEWIPLQLPLRHLLFEALRRMDEAGDVARALPHEQLVLKAASSVPPSHALQRAISSLVQRDDEVTLSRLRLALGLPRGVVVRAVFELLRAGRLLVVGASPLEVDPIADMLDKGAVLLRERQFDAASLVFGALLQSDPGDRRVREFARMAEREHIAALYRELPPVMRCAVVDDPAALAPLRAEERIFARCFETGWDLSAVVLGSTHRELETLKAVARLVRQGVLRPL